MCIFFKGEGLVERQIYNYSIPDGYQENKIVLMVRDPNCLFVYWEITDYRRDLISRHLKSDWEKLTPIIRLFDVTDREFDGYNANYYLDIKIHPMANNWYLHDISPNRSYVADYGVLNEQEVFTAILRSKTILTPRDRAVDKALPFVLPKNKDETSGWKVNRNAKEIENFSSYSVYEK